MLNYGNMIKRKLTAGNFAAIMHDSYLSESDFDDSIEGMDGIHFSQAMKVIMKMIKKKQQKTQKLFLQ